MWCQKNLAEAREAGTEKSVRCLLMLMMLIFVVGKYKYTIKHNAEILLHGKNWRRNNKGKP
jgi:hypothetical protein